VFSDYIWEVRLHRRSYIYRPGLASVSSAFFDDYLKLSTALSDTMNRSSLSVGDPNVQLDRLDDRDSQKLSGLFDSYGFLNCFTESTDIAGASLTSICRCLLFHSMILDYPIIAFFNGQFLCRGLKNPSYPSFVNHGINSTSSHCRMLSGNRSSVVLNADQSFCR